jgi:hypothetical protein
MLSYHRCPDCGSSLSTTGCASCKASYQTTTGTQIVVGQSPSQTTTGISIAPQPYVAVPNAGSEVVPLTVGDGVAPLTVGGYHHNYKDGVVGLTVDPATIAAWEVFNRQKEQGSGLPDPGGLY